MLETKIGETLAGGGGGRDFLKKHVQREGKQAWERTGQDLKVWPRKKLEKRLTKLEQQRGKKMRDRKVSNYLKRTEVTDKAQCHTKEMSRQPSISWVNN